LLDRQPPGIRRRTGRRLGGCAAQLTRSGCNARRAPSRSLEDIPAGLLNVKTSATILTPQESTELRQSFFRNIESMLAE
jgi:hypothetical protein